MPLQGWAVQTTQRLRHLLQSWKYTRQSLLCESIDCHTVLVCASAFKQCMYIHADPSGSLPPLLAPMQAPQSLWMGAFMCKIILPCYLALEFFFLEKLHILFKTVSMRSYSNSPDTWVWQLGQANICWYITACENIILFSVGCFLYINQMILLICVCRDICKEDKHCIWTRPSTTIYICFRYTVSMSTDPVTCVYCWAHGNSQPVGKQCVCRLTTSTAWAKTWVIWCLLAKSHHVIMAHNAEQVPLKQQRREGVHWKECLDHYAKTWSTDCIDNSATMIRLTCCLCKNWILQTQNWYIMTLLAADVWELSGIKITRLSLYIRKSSLHCYEADCSQSNCC